MSSNQSTTARAWRDFEFFESLPEVEQKAVSPSPVGDVKLVWRAVSSDYPDTHPASTCGSTFIADSCDTFIAGCCSTFIADTCDTFIAGCCG